MKVLRRIRRHWYMCARWPVPILCALDCLSHATGIHSVRVCGWHDRALVWRMTR